MSSKLLIKIFFVVCVAFFASTIMSFQPTVAQAQSVSQFPGDSGLGSSSDYWRDIKEGKRGTTSLPEENTEYLIRILGEDWKNIRNNMVFVYGAIGIVGMLLTLAVFYLVRGRIMLEGEPTGRKVLRFKAIERYNHWTMAVTFILLGLTGLNMLYGRAIILPIVGPEAFSAITGFGKFVHNNIAWVFMVSLVLTTIFWLKDNLWDKYDLNWILKAGGMFGGDDHPPSARFNFGEKTMFWLVVLGGVAVSFTGLTLLFPYVFGTLPFMQFMQLAHTVVAIVMVIAIFGHIYIATIGMEGAIDGMKTGYVDETWAKEHHVIQRWISGSNLIANTQKSGRLSLRKKIRCQVTKNAMARPASLRSTSRKRRVKAVKS